MEEITLNKESYNNFKKQVEKDEEKALRLIKNGNEQEIRAFLDAGYFNNNLIALKEICSALINYMELYIGLKVRYYKIKKDLKKTIIEVKE